MKVYPPARCLFFGILAIWTFFADAQQDVYFRIANSTSMASDSLLPFWFTANRQGKAMPDNRLLNLTDIEVGQPYDNSGLAWTHTWGVNAVAGLGNNNYYQLNQVYAGVSWKGWELKAGRISEDIQYAGLSTTNGNLARSGNARPYPKVVIRTRDFKPVFNKRIGFKAEYSEGILNDKRFVKNARLHQKSLYLRIELPQRWEVQAGLEHFVLWGGISPVEGKLPSGLKDYIRYITGSSGDESFPETDQRNVAGNQLGTYQIKVSKKFHAMDAVFYLSHPFEELSGLKWRNLPDNLVGMHLSFSDKNRWITDVVYEYTNTRQQSIRGTNDDPDPGNYFRHGIYRSSFTYHQQIMGSPLFFPLVLDEGIVRGLLSNRFYAHHVGLRGALTDYLQYKGVITRISHLGLYTAPFAPSRGQISGLWTLQYLNPGFPVAINLSIAADAANATNNNFGMQIGLTKEF